MKLEFSWQDFPTLSNDLPGTGGTIRATPEDFLVTELPAYEPCGEGEHLYLWLEKRGHTTKFVLDEIAKQLHIKFADIGVAGLKDRHAVTRQWVSIPKKFEDRLAGFNVPDVRILRTEAHTNKLGIGHLRGNRFVLNVQNTDPEALRLAGPILERLAVSGVPNYFGPQRFGNTAQNATRGLELVLNGKMRGPESIPLKRFLIGSLQSLLFNHYLRLRLERGLLDAFLLGDVAKKHETGGVFTVEDPSVENDRAKQFEISAFGPLFGRKMMPAHAASKALEEEVLGLFELNQTHFKDRKGARRFARIKLENTSLESSNGGYRIGFDLPKGSFATTVLREIMKTNVDGLESETETD